MTDAKPGQKITIIDEQLTLLTAWQAHKRHRWWAIGDDGLMYIVECGDDGIWWHMKER